MTSETEQEPWRRSFQQLDMRMAENTGEILRQKIAIQVHAWRRNRALYPGWIVTPWANRNLLWARTVEWIAPILAEVAGGTN